jgi:hypothetical protein
MGDDTAVIVGKDDNGFTVEGRLEDALTGHVEIITVNERKDEAFSTRLRPHE